MCESMGAPWQTQSHNEKLAMNYAAVMLLIECSLFF